jgi:hypothetical protein
MASTNYWQKTRFFHDLSSNPQEEEPAASTTTTNTNTTTTANDVSITREQASHLSPVYQLHAIATMNDRAVRVLQDGGPTGLALHFFGAAFAKARQISPTDANTIRNRNVLFSELIIPSSLSSSSSSSASSSSSPTTSTTTSTTTTSHYLVPLPYLFGDHHAAAGGGDSGATTAAGGGGGAGGGTTSRASSSTGMFVKAILLCHSPFPATVHTLIDTLQYHQGLCRHLQALECHTMMESSGGSANRRDVLHRLARQRYSAVLVPPLVRAAAYCNLLLCCSSSGTNDGDTTTTTTMEEDRHQQAFIDACHDLQDPAEIAEFRHCIHHAARAA